MGAVAVDHDVAVAAAAMQIATAAAKTLSGAVLRHTAAVEGCLWQPAVAGVPASLRMSLNLLHHTAKTAACHAEVDTRVPDSWS